MSWKFHSQICSFTVFLTTFDRTLCSFSIHPPFKTSHDISLRKKCHYSDLFWSAFSPNFRAFGLNTKRYGLSLRIQSECGKVLTRKNSYLDTFHALHMTPTFRLTPLEKPDFFILVDRFYERLETNGKYSQTYGNSSFFRY